MPFIFSRLQEEPLNWLDALHAIVDDNPVPKELQGQIGEMTKAWLSWGRENGYIS